MSTITVLKEANTLVLGTDSRFMRHDFGAIDSDSVRKIHEVAPGTFIATSGFLMACEFQEAKARELARKLGTTDIRVLASALERESLPCLLGLIEILRSVANPAEKIIQTVSGEELLHGCVLVGQAGGKLGYVSHSYRVQAGQIENAPTEYFGDKRQIFLTAGGGKSPLAQVAQEPTIWTEQPVSVVKNILAMLKRATPVIGGPDQIVCLDGGGVRWISRLAETETQPPDALAVATIAASVTMTSPTLVIGSGSQVLHIDSTHWVEASDTTTHFVGRVTPSFIQVADSTNAASTAWMDIVSGYGGRVVISSPSGPQVALYALTQPSAPLPPTPTGYWEVLIGGSFVKIPYY